MLAGPNGAGKSTFYKTRIQNRFGAEIDFINADNIQIDELGTRECEAAYAAARIAEQRRRNFMAEGKSFVTESVFSHPSKIELIRDAKSQGYQVVMYHVCLSDADLAIARVVEREKEGGHDVPEEKIRERFIRNRAIIREAVLLADLAEIHDNSNLNEGFSWALTFTNGVITGISEELPKWIAEIYAVDIAIIRS